MRNAIKKDVRKKAKETAESGDEEQTNLFEIHEFVIIRTKASFWGKF